MKPEHHPPARPPQLGAKKIPCGKCQMAPYCFANNVFCPEVRNPRPRKPKPDPTNQTQMFPTNPITQET